MVQRHSIVTVVGRNKEAAKLATAESFVLTEIALGDGDRYPAGGETELENELHRGQVTGSGVEAGEPNAVWFDLYVPANVATFQSQEIGLFDEDGVLYALSRYDAPVPKFGPDSNGLSDQTFRIVVVFSDTENIIVTLNPVAGITPDTLSDHLPWATDPEFNDENTEGRIAQVKQIHSLIGNMNAVPIFPEADTDSLRLVVTDNLDGTITVDAGQSWLWRGRRWLSLDDIDLAGRTFAFDDNEIYHLRMDAPGTGAATPIATYPKGRITLNNVDDVAYNPGALDDDDIVFDSTYDSILIARIGSNLVNLIPVMTAGTTGGVTITADTSYAGYPAWWAASASPYYPWTNAGGGYGWLKIELPAAKTVLRFSIRPRTVDPTHRPTEFHLEGSNDNAAWDNLTGTINFATWNLETNEAEFFDIPPANRAAYLYYRLVVTDTDSNIYISIGEFALFESGGTGISTLKNAAKLVGEVEKSTLQTSTNLSGETGDFVAIAHPINWARRPFATFAEQRIGAATSHLEEAIVNTFLDVNRYEVKPLVIGVYTSTTNVGGAINGRYRVPLIA